MSDTKKPSLLGSIFGMKCPNCRKGHMFKEPSILKFNHLLDMPEKCEVCGQKMELEVGFYYGTGYVSYALSVGLSVVIFVLYALIFGLTWRDNSIFIALGVDIGILVLLQPWLMRMSRVLYLNLFVKYGKGSIIQS